MSTGAEEFRSSSIPTPITDPVRPEFFRGRFPSHERPRPMSIAFRVVDSRKTERLRQWARDHYLPRDERPASWHPIVLEEMRAIDGELGMVADADGSESLDLRFRYVPLAPTSTHFIHPAHAETPRPIFLGMPGESQIADELYLPG